MLFQHLQEEFNMEKFIANQIIAAAGVNHENLAEGQEKYRKAFIYTDIYARYKDKTDLYLTDKQYQDCIVTE